MREHINENLMGEFGGGMDNTLSPASYNVQGKGPGYVYSVLPMSDNLQQPGNELSREYYIYPGCMVRGNGYNNRDKKYTGQVNRIVKDGQGVIVCLYIKTVKNNRIVSIVADDDLRLLLPEDPEQSNTMMIATSDNMRINY